MKCPKCDCYDTIYYIEESTAVIKTIYTEKSGMIVDDDIIDSTVTKSYYYCDNCGNTWKEEHKI